MRKTVFLVTGGIGSGKSVVSSILRDAGFPVYDSDNETKRLYNKDKTLISDIESCVGHSLSSQDGSFDTKALAKSIFSDPVKREAVESVLYPLVLDDFIHWASLQSSDIVGMESAVASDKKIFEGLFDMVIFVDAPQEVRLERAAIRDQSSREKILARIRSQVLSPGKADFIVDNSGSQAQLRERLVPVIRYMRQFGHFEPVRIK